VQANGSSAYSYSTKTYDLSAGEDNTDLPPVGEMKESVEGAVDEHKDNKQYFAELELMIEQGDIDEAEEKCEQLLKSGDSSAHLFYLLGSIAKLGNNLLQSEELLKKAIYLEPKNVKSLMALSAIAEEQGDEKKSEDYKRRVEMVKSRQNNDG
jgi:tetratricopeptide (TPR) repeat protein